MSKLKIVKFGDGRGVGAIVETTSFFGTVRTWTLIPNTTIDGTTSDSWFLDKWVCRENGESIYRDCCNVCRFYTAQYLTRPDV